MNLMILIPAKKWRYNNSGYVLLKPASSRKFRAQLTRISCRRIFSNRWAWPIAASTTLSASRTHEALGYSYSNEQFTRAVSLDPSWTIGTGNLYSTVEDLNKWNEAIFNGRVLKPASLKDAFTPAKTAENQDDDSGDGYGCGWFISQWRGLLEISHGGYLPGFNSFLLRIPNEKFTVIVLANSGPGAHHVVPDTLGQELAEIYLRDKLAPLPVPNTAVSAKTFGALVGRYEFRGQTISVTTDGTHLFGQFDGEPKIELFPTSETEFFWKVVYARIKFVKDANGKVVKAIFRKNGETLYGPRVSSSSEH